MPQRPEPASTPRHPAQTPPLSQAARRPAAMALAVAGAIVAAPGQAQPPSSRIFYIDYASGNDTADGLSPTTAWKHAPGDTMATGRAAALNRKFLPGDVLRFKGGVRYLGTITPRGEGSAAQPVILDGSGWGSLRAIIDGGNELPGLRRCSSAADCLGNPAWPVLWRASLPADARWYDWLFVDDRPLMPAQYPAVSTALDFDDVTKFQAVPKAALAALQAGQINQTLPAGLNKGAPVLSIWARGNLVSYASNIQVSTKGVNFAAATWDIRANDPYTDRDNRFALINLPMMVNRPGLYAMSPRDGVVIFWPHNKAGGMAPTDGAGGISSTAARAVIGGARRGIQPSAFKHIVVRGFSFTNFSRESAVYAGTNNDNVEISWNSFRGVANTYTRKPVISMVFATNVAVTNNDITETPGTPGINISASQGPIAVICNRLTQIGRTGIVLLGVRDATVKGNFLSQVKGAHSNGITAYLDIRDTVISDNVVVDTVRPLTVHGVKTTPTFNAGTPGTLVKNNVFINSDASAPAVTSYGNTKNFTLENNFIGSPRKAISLLGTDVGLLIRNNVYVGTVVQPKGMSLVNASNSAHLPDGNGQALMSARQKASVPESLCG